MTTARSLFAQIPGPPPARVVGWRGSMLRFFGDPITYMERAHRIHGNVVAFTKGGNGNLITTINNCPGTVFGFGAACNQTILAQPGVFQSSPMATSELNHTATTRLLSGIFSMNGDKHRQQRRLMMPAFHKKRIETYRDDMTSLTLNMLKDWQPGAVRDIHQDMMELTLQIACKTLFGVDVRGSGYNIGTTIHRWIKMNLNPAVMLKIDLPGTPYRRFIRTADELNAAFQEIVDRKRNSGDEGDVLSMLIQSRDEDGEQMTEDELIGQANILFFAGHETTANAVTWALFLLSQNPKIYANVVEELEGVLHGESPTIDQIGQLDLLERVIKESMRVLPPVPFLLRFAAEDTELGGYGIPTATEVIFSPYITHHSPEIYSDPTRFDPDRWLTINPSPYEYIPFGAGIRMCIGATFAMLESKILLSIILQNYRLALHDARVDRDVQITLAPKNGLRFQIHPPDKDYQAGAPPIEGNINELVKLS